MADARKQPAKRIPVAAARAIADAYGQDQVVLLAWNKTDGYTHLVTYGRTIQDCRQAAEGGNRMKRVMGWPEAMCNATPRRVKRRATRQEPTDG